MIEHIFRIGEDGWRFPFFGTFHICFLIFTSLCILWIIKNRNSLSDKKAMSIEKTFAIILIVCESSRYIWKIAMRDFSLIDDLPLYHCRITMYVAAYALITKHKSAVSFAVYWGIFGGFLAIISPDPYKYTPPHFTNVAFFVGHLSLLISATYMAADKKFSFDKASLVSVTLITNIFNITATVASILLKANYAFMLEPPVFKQLLMSFGQIPYTISTYVFLNLINVLIYLIGGQLKKNYT